MRTSNATLLSTDVVGSANSTAIDLNQMTEWDAVASITDNSPSNKTFVSGVAEVDQITFATKAGTTDGDYFVLNDYLGGSWAVALDTTGTAANTPTGAAWVAVASANKVYTDISGATSGTDVEVLVATAINALTGFTAVITTGNSTTHMNCTDVAPGVVTAPTVYSKAGAAGTGSVTKSVTTTGTATKVSPSADTVTVTAHGYTTGLKVRLTTTSALPTGVTTGVDYYLIKVDANTLQFATTLANALAGTAIDLTDYGVGTQTIAVQAIAGSIKTQKSEDQIGTVSPTWVDIASGSQSYPSLPGSLTWTGADSSYQQLRFVVTNTGGIATIAIKVTAKGP